MSSPCSWLTGSSALDLVALPANYPLGMRPHPLFRGRAVAASTVFGSQRFQDVLSLLEAGGKMS